MSKRNIEDQNLNVIFGRVLTVLEAIGAIPEGGDNIQTATYSGGVITYPENSRRNAIKSLISDAIFDEIIWAEDKPKKK